MSSLEQELLLKRFYSSSVLPQVLSAQDAIKLIGKLGGHIGRKKDHPPGIISLWRGWTRLMNMVNDYKILTGFTSQDTYG